MSTQTVVNLPFYIVIGLAALSFPIGLIAIIYFHTKTYRIVGLIKNIYRDRGENWQFWTNKERLISFVLHPDAILKEDPNVAADEKMLLVRHRWTMKGYMTRTFAYMFGSFGLAVLVLLTTALFRR